MNATYQMMKRATDGLGISIEDGDIPGLISEYQNTRDSDILALIYVKYFYGMQKIASKYHSVDVSEKESLSLITCERALRNYNPDRGVKFFSYLLTLWERELITQMGKGNKLTHLDGNNIMLEWRDNTSDDNSAPIENLIQEERPLLLIEKGYRERDFELSINNLLDSGILKSGEKVFIEGILNDLTNKEIANQLNVSVARVYWIKLALKELFTKNQDLYDCVFG